MHLVHGQGGDEVDAGVTVQILVGGLLHHGGQVNGIDQLHLGEGIGHPAQGGHDVGHGLAVILPPVAGDQNDLFALIVQLIQNIFCKGEILYNCGLEGIDDGVASEKDVLGDVFPGQVVPVGGGGTEVQVGQGAHHLPIHLLGEGGPLVIGAQTGLHMAHGDLVIESGQGPGEGGGGVPVDQDQVGLGLLQHALHAQQAFGGDGGQGLPGLHDIQVIVGLELENIQHRVQHLPVLGSDAAQGLDARAALELQGQGGHFNGLGTGAENGHHFDIAHGVVSSFLSEDLGGWGASSSSNSRRCSSMVLL